MKDKKLYLITVGGLRRLARYLRKAANGEEGFEIRGGFVSPSEVSDVEKIPGEKQGDYYDSAFN